MKVTIVLIVLIALLHCALCEDLVTWDPVTRQMSVSEEQFEKIVDPQKRLEAKRALLTYNQMLQDEDAAADKKLINWKESTKCVKIYGNYCGPGYCDKQKWDQCSGSAGNQNKCNYYSGAVADSVDSCCRTHDRECVLSRSSGNCNHAKSNILSCLSNSSCKWNDASCHLAKTMMQTFFSLRRGCC